jgi:hypothetical protein
MLSSARPGDAQAEYRVATPRTLLAVALFAVLVAGLAPIESVSATAREAPRNSADRIIVWTGCDSLVQLTNANLDEWRDRGVDGFSCQVRRLAGMGGRNEFTGDLTGLRGEQYVLERTLRDTRIVERAKQRGMKLYLAFYFANASNYATPLAEWFDDTAWSDTVIPAVRGIASAARALGFAGLAFDQELYTERGDPRTSSWKWNYPGNTSAEGEVRSQVRKRGEEMMQAILEGFPNVDILAYYTKFPETWDELVQEEVNGNAEAFADWVQIDFWDGLTRVEGFRSIRFLNATFYKIPHLGDWDVAYTYQYNRLFAFLSRRLSNWDYAAGRIFETPFVWINAGQRPFEAARSPEHVEEQLLRARHWGMGRLLADYAYGDLEKFDYGPYEPAMREASRPDAVDREPPEISVSTSASPSEDGRMDLAGTATDNMAIRWVRWKTDAGASGTAEMIWTPAVDDASFPKLQSATGLWEMQLNMPGIPVRPGRNLITVTAEDIKGLRTREVVVVRR